MLTVQVDQEQIERQFLGEMRKHLNEIKNQFTFWDMKELCRQTNMSPNFIKDTFFYDPRFPKYRVGKKWIFPAKECEKFLLTWLAEQPRN